MKKTLVLLILAVAGVAVAQGLQPQRRGLLGGNRTRPNAPGLQAAAPAAAPASVDELADGSSLNFNQTALELVFEAYGRMVGKTILKDPQCPTATITLKSEKGQKLTQEEQIEAIEVVLEMNGVHLEPYGEKFVRALPRKDARKEGIPLLMDSDSALKESGKVISMMIPFKNISLEDAQKILDAFRSATGTSIAIERTNAILITDTEMNINRMREIAKAIDIATPVTEVVEYIQIKNANATEIKQVLDSIVQESMKEQEKSGKTPQNGAQTGATPPTPFGGGLLRRAGQNNNQQQAPAVNQSLLMAVSEADRGMIRGKVVTIADERSNKILIITNASNMKFFKQVIEALDVETTPDTVVKVYRLKYAEAEDVSDMINDLIGNSVSSKNGSKNSQNQNAKKGQSGSVTRNTTQPAAAKKPANQRTGEAKAGELSKENTTVLADKRINGLVVMTTKELVPTIEQIIESMDIKLSQVLIETTIIEVTLGDGIETGMDWIQKGRQQQVEQTQNVLGQNMFYKQRTITKTGTDGSSSSTSILSDLVPSGYSASTTTTKDGITTTISDAASDVAAMLSSSVDRDGIMNYWKGATAVGLGGGSSGGSQIFDLASGLATNVFGRSFSFIFDSDELGISAILQAAKNDSHSKYVASPIVMTLDNKEAVVEATSSRQFLTGWTAQSSSVSGGGLPAPNYTAKDIGIKLKVTPKINPNGTVMLEVEEEYSQVSGTQKMLSPSGSSYVDRDIDVAVTRKMESDVLLENNQTVVFGGLTQTLTSESETGIPILKDIPYIGKWLFGSVKESEDRVELLVFMTPYVLDDAQAAQAEAIRRKKTMSDPRPWDDHGWSLSELADSVSKKEQMRRIKDEWKKQDEERQTRLEIEKEKIKRAEKLKEMSAAEREQWLKLHKEELEKEQQEELEKKMQDEKSQEELKKLAAEVRATKLKEAEKELKKAEEETASQNERAKLDAEKAAKKAAEKEKVEKVGGGGEGEPAEVKPVEVKPAEVKPVAGAGGLADLAAEKK